MCKKTKTKAVSQEAFKMYTRVCKIVKIEARYGLHDEKRIIKWAVIFYCPLIDSAGLVIVKARSLILQQNKHHQRISCSGYQMYCLDMDVVKWKASIIGLPESVEHW